MLLTINLLCGLVAVILMSRVLWHLRESFVPDDWNNMTAADFMRLSVAVFHVKGLARIAFYDVWIVLYQWERAAWVSYANIGFCLLASVASWLALKALK